MSRRRRDSSAGIVYPNGKKIDKESPSDRMPTKRSPSVDELMKQWSLRAGALLIMILLAIPFLLGWRFLRLLHLQEQG